MGWVIMNITVLNCDCCTEYEYLLLKTLSSSFDTILQNNFSGFPDELKNFYSHDDCNDTQIYYSPNNSLENDIVEYDLTSPHLKDKIQNNATTSSNLNSPFQVIPQKSNIGLLCNNPECFNEIEILRFGKGRKNMYCSKQCFTRKNNCNRKKSSTNFNENLLNDRKEFVKFINEGASKFNIGLFYFFSYLEKK
jgi:hypothetical protein